MSEAVCRCEHLTPFDGRLTDFRRADSSSETPFPLTAAVKELHLT